MPGIGHSRLWNSRYCDLLVRHTLSHHEVLAFAFGWQKRSMRMAFMDSALFAKAWESPMSRGIPCYA